MAHIKVTIGRARCGDFRDFLAEQKFKGREIDYIESSGFLERDFTVKGSDADIIFIKQCFDNWAKSEV